MIHDPQSLYESIKSKIKGYAATRPGDYFVANDVEVQMCLDDLRRIRTRRQRNRRVPGINSVYIMFCEMQLVMSNHDKSLLSQCVTLHNKKLINPRSAHHHQGTKKHRETHFLEAPDSPRERCDPNAEQTLPKEVAQGSYHQ